MSVKPDNPENQPFSKDVQYVPTFNGTATPAQIATAAGAVGLETVDLEAPFRYLDIGCGRGITLLTLATAYPSSEFIGIDYNPDHIAEAQARAERCKLGNVSFRCAAFDAPDLSDIAPVDFAVAFGIFSWVAETQQEQVGELFRRLVKPDGLVAVSYNTQAGGAQLLPIRALLQSWVAGSSSPPLLARVEALNRMMKLRAQDIPFFEASPVARSFVDSWADEDPRYVVHEILGESWNLFTVSDIAGRLQRHGFHFLGDRTAMLDAGSITEECSDAAMAEDLVTFANMRPFRTDIFARRQPPDTIVPRFPETTRFGPAWPMETATMSEQAKRPTLAGKLLSLTASEPLAWSEILASKLGRDTSPQQIAAALRQAMTTWTMTRLDGPIDVVKSPTDAFRLAHPFGVEMLSSDDLRRMDPALPSRRHGGAVRIPPLIARMIDAGARGLAVHEWASYVAGEGNREDFEVADRASSQVLEVWVPFLIEAGVLTPLE